jgi:3-oxoacyl-[acyl-carrier protein] reductase
MTFEKLENLNNKVVVITGGCGQVGYATAKRLASIGAKIIVVVRRNLEDAQEKMNQLPNNHLGHRAYLASITDTNSIKQIVSDIKEKEGKCDILVNAAGITRAVGKTNFRNITDEIFDEIIINNIRGTFAVIREFYDLLNDSGDGLVINISSTSALYPRNNVAYGASKAGVNVLTQGLARALSPNIRIIGISPGFLQNPTSGAIARSIEQDLEVIKRSPLKRIVTGDDIASVIEGFALNLRYVTGQTIVVDGGLNI